MADEIRPALTTEQWDSMHMAQPGADLEIRLTDDGSYRIHPPSLHAIAALALHGQSFGFTRKDTAVLHCAARTERNHPVGDHDVREANARSLEEIADRIAALLPPA